MTIIKKFGTALTAMVFMLFLAACDDGPFEDAGEHIDDAAQETADRVEDACEELSQENC